jgi:hypothetical protein
MNINASDYTRRATQHRPSDPDQDAWIIIPPSIVQQLSGGNIASMPSEPLQLSQEMAANFLGAWPAVFQALGFTSFVPTVGAIPTMNC